MSTNSLDEQFTITCAKCSKTAPVYRWKERGTGELPDGEYQCPHCGDAFRREANPDDSWRREFRPVVLTPIDPRL